MHATLTAGGVACPEPPGRQGPCPEDAGGSSGRSRAPISKDLTELTDEQRKAVRFYTGMGYVDVRRYLGNANASQFDAPMSEIQDVIRGMDSILDARELAKRVVYRGVKYNRWSGSLKVGDEIDTNAFQSTSVSKEVASSFSHKLEGDTVTPGTILQIHVPEGFPGADFTPFSSFEQEVMLPRETHYRITKITPGSTSEDSQLVDVDAYIPKDFQRDKAGIYAGGAACDTPPGRQGPCKEDGTSDGDGGGSSKVRVVGPVDMDKLSRPEELAIDLYTNRHFAPFNKFARTGQRADVYALEHRIPPPIGGGPRTDSEDAFHALDKLVNESRLAEPTLLYRGVNGERVNELREGDEFPAVAFQSFTTRENQAIDFATNKSSIDHLGEDFAEDRVPTFITTEVGTNVPALDLTKANPTEKEVIVGRNAWFRVKSIRRRSVYGRPQEVKYKEIVVDTFLKPDTKLTVPITAGGVACPTPPGRQGPCAEDEGGAGMHRGPWTQADWEKADEVTQRAIRDYQGYNFSTYNDYTRTGDDGQLVPTWAGNKRERAAQLQPWFEKIAALDKLVSNSRLAKDTTLYRGFNLARVPEQLKPGDEFSAQTFQSTSTSRAKALDFSERKRGKAVSLGLLTIKTGTDVPALDVTAHGSEKEVVLGRNVWYRVKQVEHIASDPDIFNQAVTNITVEPFVPAHPTVPLKVPIAASIEAGGAACDTPPGRQGPCKEDGSGDAAGDTWNGKVLPGGRNLAPEVADALESYTALAYEDMRTYLLTGKAELSETPGQVAHLDKAIASARLPQAEKVWRGVGGRRWTEAMFQPGNILQSGAFQSTTTALWRAKAFAHGSATDSVSSKPGVVLRIEVPKNYPALDLTDYSVEQEVLLDRRTAYRVLQYVPAKTANEPAMVRVEAFIPEKDMKAGGVACPAPPGRQGPCKEDEGGTQALHEQHVDHYIGDGPWDDAKFRRERAWKAAMQQALSVGAVSPEEAVARGYHFSGHEQKENSTLGRWTTMPGQLYHVTTATDAVRDDGLKSRVELSMDRALGLGGGEDASISFTDNRDIAENIYHTIQEAVKVAKDTVTLKDLVDRARAGGYLENFIRLQYAPDWKSGQPLPDNLTSEMQGMHLHNGVMGRTAAQLPEGARFVGETWKGGDGIERGMRWEVPMTHTDALDTRWSAYQMFLAARQMGGGPENPLFFGTDAAGLANVDLSQVSIVSAQPKPKARGYQMSSLGEWRTHSGKAVTLTGFEHPVKSALYFGGAVCDAPPGRQGPCKEDGSSEGDGKEIPLKLTVERHPSPVESIYVYEVPGAEGAGLRVSAYYDKISRSVSVSVLTRASDTAGWAYKTRLPVGIKAVRRVIGMLKQDFPEAKSIDSVRETGIAPGHTARVALAEAETGMSPQEFEEMLKKLWDLDIHATILKLPSGKYRLVSQTLDKGGKRKNLGTFATRKEAVQHEHEVEYFKHVTAGGVACPAPPGRQGPCKEDEGVDVSDDFRKALDEYKFQPSPQRLFQGTPWQEFTGPDGGSLRISLGKEGAWEIPNSDIRGTEASSLRDYIKLMQPGDIANGIDRRVILPGMLSNAENQAVTTYMGDSFRDINGVALHDDKMASGMLPKAQAAAHVASLDQVMARSRLSEPLDVFRGMNGNRVERLKVGDEFPADTFMSASTEPGVAAMFSDHSIAEISVPTNVPAMNLTEMNADEKEVLIGRNVWFKVTGLSTIDLFEQEFHKPVLYDKTKHVEQEYDDDGKAVVDPDDKRIQGHILQADKVYLEAFVDPEDDLSWMETPLTPPQAHKAAA